SDARYRFERGVDPAFVEPGLDLATRLILEMCGGEASQVTVAGRAPLDRMALDFNPSEIKRLTGVELPLAETTRILTALGFEPRANGSKLALKAPTWRPDIDGNADIVEEIVRIHGLDHVPSTPMTRPPASAGAILTPLQKRLRITRRALAARGLTEAVTWSFIAHGEAALFGGANAAVVLANPISSEMDTMRPSLLAGLLAAARRNTDRGLTPVLLFEVGQQFRGDETADESFVAALVRKGPALRHWTKPANGDTAFDAKADAAALLTALGAPRDLQTTDDAPGWYHPGRSGTLRLGPKVVLAHFGELHPRVLKAFDIDGPVAAAEIFVETVPEPKAKPTKAKPPLDASDLMAVKRDFAFLVDVSVKAAEMVRAAKNVDKALIAEVVVFDVYEGERIEAGKKSIALEVTLQPKEKTLTEEEIDAVSKKIVGAVEKSSGGTLRG
ncbi:MAG TPA: phenylalanine--tRNA ligase subunit beta, partial [Alphaproteobacteria bacterium]|nr:phenylalanine--tRNA ligase subunit beta [Alphaproteobacteria bacterium]